MENEGDFFSQGFRHRNCARLQNRYKSKSKLWHDVKVNIVKARRVRIVSDYLK